MLHVLSYEMTVYLGGIWHLNIPFKRQSFHRYRYGACGVGMRHLRSERKFGAREAVNGLSLACSSHHSREKVTHTSENPNYPSASALRRHFRSGCSRAKHVQSVLLYDY